MAKQRSVADAADAAPWALQTLFYDLSGRLLRREVTLDDGGTAEIDYDAAGAFAWSSLTRTYDAAGRRLVEEVRHDDGGRDVIRSLYDARGQLSAETAHLADGGRSSSRYTYDEQGRLQVSATNHADGSRAVTRHDADGTEAWSAITVTYDAATGDAARIRLRVDTILDQGEHVAVVYDTKGWHPWSRAVHRWDAAGRLAHEAFAGDDGSRSVTRHDAGEAFSWQSLTRDEDAAGRLVHERTLLDDGSRTDRFHDAAGLAAWSACTIASDAQGETLSRVVDLDAGFHVELQADRPDAEPWLLQARFRLADGAAACTLTLRDIGSLEEVFGAVPWRQSISRDGKVVLRTAELGGGATLVLSHDAAGAQDWIVAAALQDADGNLLFHAAINHDGSFTVDPVVPAADWPV